MLLTWQALERSYQWQVALSTESSNGTILSVISSFTTFSHSYGLLQWLYRAPNSSLLWQFASGTLLLPLTLVEKPQFCKFRTNLILSYSKGIKWIFMYNFGSLAFGSLLLALVWFAIIVFEYLNKKLGGNGNGGLQNPVTKCMAGACRCCLQCCHRFIKFLNRNAFVQLALHSKNFCTSAMNAFLLVLKNSGTFFISEGIGSIFIFLGKIFISVGNTLGCYLILTKWKEMNENINSPIGPIITVFVIS